MAEFRVQPPSEEPEFVVDIFLQPGDFYWGDSDTRIRTLLGSCVSIAIWHPVLREGGMCHFLLPSVPNGTPPGAVTRYAEGAMEAFLSQIQKKKKKPKEFIAKVFGGGSMLHEVTDNVEIIGQKNIRAAHELLEKNGFSISAEDTGGTVYRRIQFHLWSGEVWVKKKDPSL